MKEDEIELPSGLRGLVRGMEIDELNILTDRAAMRSGVAFDRILEKCWIRTLDAGRAYSEDVVRGVPRWSRVLASDRFVTLFRIRGLTWGDEYRFTAVCPDCEERRPTMVLLSQMPVRRLPDASAEVLRSGKNRFELWLPDPEKGREPPEGFVQAQLALEDWQSARDHGEDAGPDPRRGWAVAVKLIDGAAEIAGAKDARESPEERVTVSLKHRVVALLGAPDLVGGEGDTTALERWINRLSAEVGQDLADLADDLDGGIDTEWEGYSCASCGYNEGLELPFGRDFWMRPKRKKRLLRAKRRKR